MGREQAGEAVTQQQIAERCGVTKATVSMALRGDPRISQATAERVHAAAGEMGYDPSVNLAARRLAMRRRGSSVRNRVVGVLGPDRIVSVEYFRRLAEGVFDVLLARRYGVLYVSAMQGPGETSLPRWSDPLARGEIDGLVTFGPAFTLDTVGALRARAGFGPRPAVVLIHDLPGCCSVLTDDESAARQTFLHLLGLGHRHFLQLVYGEADLKGEPRQRRRRGARRALEEFGLDPSRHLHSCPVPAHWMAPAVARRLLARPADDAGGAAVVEHLRAHPEITAVLGDNDAMAIFAYVALRRAGVDVPGRVSIVGFDDTDPIPADGGANCLSSVSLPLEEVGRTGAAMLLEQIEGRSAPDRRIVLPARFVPRQTVGPAPARGVT